MAQSGQLVQWNDERGFGFIEGQDGQRHFVHISAIGRIATRPRTGDSVTFVAGRGADGRPQAHSVRIVGANLAADRAIGRRGDGEHGRMVDWRYGLAAALLALICVGALLDRLPMAIVLAYLVMTAISFLAYRADKAFAETGHWRISEGTLLSVDLAFGVVGGLLGQAVFRHKTRKPAYLSSVLVISTVHLIWLGGLVTGLIDLARLPDGIATLFGAGG